MYLKTHITYNALTELRGFVIGVAPVYYWLTYFQFNKNIKEGNINDLCERIQFTWTIGR